MCLHYTQFKWVSTYQNTRRRLRAAPLEFFVQGCSLPNLQQWQLILRCSTWHHKGGFPSACSCWHLPSWPEMDPRKLGGPPCTYSETTYDTMKYVLSQPRKQQGALELLCQLGEWSVWGSREFLIHWAEGRVWRYSSPAFSLSLLPSLPPAIFFSASLSNLSSCIFMISDLFFCMYQKCH